MKKNTLFGFLNLDKNIKGVDLSLDNLEDNKERINKLFDIALDEKYILFYDGRFVDDPYDGYEFQSLEEEFYYNNGNSYLVFQDKNTEEKVSFKVKSLKDYDFDTVYKIVEKAVEYTKEHPEVSEYKIY